MKKFLIIFTLLIIIMSLATISFANTSLADVKGTKYEEAVNNLVSEGIINGYLDKTFKPENEITRAEMAKILVVAAKLSVEAEKNTTRQIFPDVQKEYWASKYINFAYQNDYIEGYEDGNFGPDKNVTYAEAITMVVRMLGYKTAVEAKGEWPDNYINKAENLKILNNVDYTKKNANAKRGEIANLVWNAIRETKTYYKAGILEDVNVDKLGEAIVKIDGTEYTFKANDNINVDIEKYLNSVIFYKLKQGKDEGFVTFISGLTATQILKDNYDDYVIASEIGKVLFENRGVESFKETFKDDFDDYIFIKFDFSVEEKEAIVISLVATSDKINFENFEEFDRVYIDKDEELVFIVEGLEEKVNK